MSLSGSCCCFVLFFVFFVSNMLCIVWFTDPTNPYSIQLSVTFVPSSHCFADDTAETQIDLGGFWGKHYVNGEAMNVKDGSIGTHSLSDLFNANDDNKNYRRGMCSFQKSFSNIKSKCDLNLKGTILDPMDVAAFKFEPVSNGDKVCTPNTECKFKVTANKVTHDVTVSTTGQITSSTATICSKRLYPFLR